MPRSRDQDWRYDIKVGKELRYPKEVIEALKAEGNPRKRERILTNARRRYTG